jgi:hydrogenase-4 component F
VYQVVSASDLDERFYSYPLMGFGLFSMGMAAAFLSRQVDFKRMLAYSSVEHVGILALALGLGKGALFGMLLHMLGNGLAKGALFLSSGTLHRVYGGKGTAGMSGALRRLPWSGAIFLAGFLAVSAFPPSLIFLSEFGIATSAFKQGNWQAGAIFLIILVFVFLGMAPTVLSMVMGTPPANMPETEHRESLLHVAPPLLLILLVMLLGAWMPEPVAKLLREAAGLISGGCR